MTVNKPNSRIIRVYPNRRPSSRRHRDSVPLRRIHQIVLDRILLRVEVSEPSSDHEEVVSVHVQRMVLDVQETRPLEHDLEPRSELDFEELGPELGVHVLRHGIDSREVESARRFLREVEREHPFALFPVVALEDGDRRTDERDVVHRGEESLPVVPLAVMILGTVLEVEADRGDHALVDPGGDSAGILLCSEALDAVGESRRELRVKHVREHRACRQRCG